MKKILLVVDMQKGFQRYDQTRILSEKVDELLKKDLFDVVIATRFMNEDHSVFEQLLDWSKLKSEEERAFSDCLEHRADYVQNKYIYNCVDADFLQRLCQLNDGSKPDQVFIVGADTDCCVLTIATSLFENSIRPVVLCNYCDSNGGPESHAAGILCMERLIGSDQLFHGVINSKDELEKI